MHPLQAYKNGASAFSFLESLESLIQTDFYIRREHRRLLSGKNKLADSLQREMQIYGIKIWLLMSTGWLIGTTAWSNFVSETNNPLIANRYQGTVFGVAWWVLLILATRSRFERGTIDRIRFAVGASRLMELCVTTTSDALRIMKRYNVFDSIPSLRLFFI